MTTPDYSRLQQTLTHFGIGELSWDSYWHDVALAYGWTKGKYPLLEMWVEFYDPSTDESNLRKLSTGIQLIIKTRILKRRNSKNQPYTDQEAALGAERAFYWFRDWNCLTCKGRMYVEVGESRITCPTCGGGGVKPNADEKDFVRDGIDIVDTEFRRFEKTMNILLQDSGDRPMRAAVTGRDYSGKMAFMTSESLPETGWVTPARYDIEGA